MAAPMPVAFYDPTNPADRRVRLGPGGAQLPVARHPRLLARRLRAGAQSGPPRQPVPVRRARRGSRGHLPPRQRQALRRGHGRRRAAADRAAVPVGLGRIAALRGGGLVRGHPGHLGIAPPASPRGPEHRDLRHPLVDDRHRRVPRRRPERSRLSGTDRALVPVRGVLPAVPAARRPAAPGADRLRDDRRPERGVVLRRRRLPAHRGRAAAARAAAALHPRADAGGGAARASRRCGRCSSTSPQDPDAWQIEDEFLFGPDLLIAPVLEPGASARDVYLPAGRAWIEAGTGDRHDGGSAVRVALSADRIPVFVAEGSEVLDVVR